MDTKSAEHPRLFYSPCKNLEHDSLAEPPDPMTEPCLAYFRHDAQLLKFLAFYTHLNLAIHALNKHAADIRISFEKEQAENEFKESFLFVIDTGATEFSEYVQLLYEMAFCTNINNYLTYIAELLSLTFRARPEALRSSQMMEVQEVLRHRTMEELVDTIADRRVNQLAYKGMEDLNKELTRSLGMPLFHNPDDLRRAKAFIEMRNLIVHGRSTVNSRFLSRLGYGDLKLGERIRIDDSVLKNARRLLAAAVSRLDKEAATKFNLATPITRSACGL